MKATAKVILQMGLLSINSKMYSATGDERVHLNQLHDRCKHRLEQKMYCPECDHLIVDKASEITRGYPVKGEDGQAKWIVLTDQEIESCKKESNGVLKIMQFVANDEIPAIYHESASYLAPEKDSSGTFGLLYHLLLTMNRTALAKCVLRQKDHFFAIRPYDSVLICYDLHFPDEIRGTKEIAVPEMDSEFDDETVHLAKALVEKMSKPFNPELIRDEYTLQMQAIIQAKAEGKIVPIEEVKKVRKVTSLKESLTESLQEAVNF